MASVVCPKCGFQQEAGTECLRCGIIFERYQRMQDRAQGATPVSAPAPAQQAPPAGPFRRFYRVFRWVVLGGTVLASVLILRQSEPPQVKLDPEANRRIQSKLEAVQSDLNAGRPHTLRLQEAEVNSWLSSNLAFAPQTAPSVRPENPTGTESTSGGNPTIEEVQSSVRDVKIDLTDDHLQAYLVFNFHGKDLSLLLEGGLHQENGYLRLRLTGGKLGSLPLPQTVLERAVQRVFESPENKEKFHLPPEIADIRVENSELVVSYR